MTQLMSSDAFAASLAGPAPPSSLPGPLAALWWDFKEDWAAAHAAVAPLDSTAAAWVHAYLHRKEGDVGNAGYWYARASRPVSRQPLEAERQVILDALLAGSEAAGM